MVEQRLPALDALVLKREKNLGGISCAKPGLITYSNDFWEMRNLLVLLLSDKGEETNVLILVEVCPDTFRSVWKILTALSALGMPTRRQQ